MVKDIRQYFKRSVTFGTLCVKAHSTKRDYTTNKVFDMADDMLCFACLHHHVDNQLPQCRSPEVD